MRILEFKFQNSRYAGVYSYGVDEILLLNMFYLDITSKKKHYGFLLYDPWTQGFEQLYIFAPPIAATLVNHIERDLYIKAEYLKNYIGFNGSLQ